MPRVILEIAVDSVADALAATGSGADRLELCIRLRDHGLSADPETARELVQRCGLPVIAMVRPLPGGFVVDGTLLDAMLREVDALIDAGADGIAFGALTPDGGLDEEATARIIEACAGRQPVFHRAFDMLPDPIAAIDALARLGIARILTAGMTPDQSAAALGLGPGPAAPLPARLARLRTHIAHAGARIQVIACGGIRQDNILRFVAAGCAQLHSACRTPAGDRMDPIEMEALREALDDAGA